MSQHQLLFIWLIYLKLCFCISNIDDLVKIKKECEVTNSYDFNSGNYGLLEINQDKPILLFEKKLKSSILSLKVADENYFPLNRNKCEHHKCILEKIDFVEKSSIDEIRESLDINVEKNKFILRCFETFLNSLEIDNIGVESIKNSENFIININEENQSVINTVSKEDFEGENTDHGTIFSNKDFCDHSLILFKCLDELD